jgi:hypothetical protein
MTEATLNNTSTVSTAEYDDLPSIADSAMLAILRRKPLRTAKRMDEMSQNEVREFIGDEGVTVSTHLFREVGSPVRELIKMDGQAYRFHRENTLAWVDSGPRLLMSHMFDKYNAGKNEVMDRQNRFKSETVLPNWDQIVERDIKFRQQAAYAEQDSAKRAIKLARISEDDYPTADQIDSKFSLEFRLRMIGGNDERVRMSKEAVLQAKADTRLEMQDAVLVARKDLAKRMAEPLTRAVAKLKVPLDDNGAVFRNTLVENLYEALEEVKGFQFSDDPYIADAIQKADEFLLGHMPSTEALRTTQGARSHAANSLDELSRIFTNLQ